MQKKERTRDSEIQSEKADNSIETISMPTLDEGKKLKTEPSEVSEFSPGEKAFPIVGIGASAGGLEAFTKLLEELPANTGMAFAFIQHLAPGQESMLTDILARSTEMKVHKVVNDMPVQPNNVYVIPPDVSMTIVDRVLKLQKEVSRLHRPVDQFMISLAQDVKSFAIGVILSGTGTDGTEGLKAIYAEGGITFTQDEDTAKYPGMPHSAISSETVHFVLPPEKIAEELKRIGKHPYLNRVRLLVVKPKPQEADSFSAILSLLKLAFNVNFAAYKESTINRRISRRMVLHQIDKIEDYVKLLRGNKGALQALFDDLLIGVTSFFREPETFKELCERVFPVIVKKKQPEVAVRVWVPGCATGEEVYSLAIVLREYMERAGASLAIQIFGTDVSEKNIEKARAGIYPETISENVSDERLRHFFNKLDQKYQILKSIRDICVFAKQDLTRDPPFSNIDLISCRNVLIYLKPEAQKRIIPLFHYALKADGFLVLGKSESIGAFQDLFEAVDRVPVYVRKPGPGRLPLEFELGEAQLRRQGVRKRELPERPLTLLQKEAERILMSKYSPPGVIVDNDLNVIMFSGDTSKFLTHGSGEASFNLLNLAREELRLELQTALYLARRQKETVKRESIQFKHSGQFNEVDIEVIPIVIPKYYDKHFLVLFERVEPLSKEKARPKKAKDEAAGAIIEELKREVAANKETLQTIIEEQEATNEELRAALEEVQSTNEELQSTNEELETAKEELQSTNEELNTVNEELTRRNRDLTQVHDDLTNMFANIDVPIIVLDRSLKIRLYTPAAERQFHLIPSDAGRPIGNISLGINLLNIEKMLEEVIDNLATKRVEVQDKNGRWYEVRFRPYLTSERKIDGVVLSFVDIDPIIRSKIEIEKSRDFSEAVLSTMGEPVAVLDADLKLIMANPSFYDTIEVVPNEAKQKPIFKWGSQRLGGQEFENSLKKIVSEKTDIDDIVLDNDVKVGQKVHVASLRSLPSKTEGTKLFLLTMKDVTNEREKEKKLLLTKKDLEKTVEESTKKLKESERLAAIGQTAGMVGHDIRNPLQSIVSATYLLKQEILEMPQTDSKKSMLESAETIEEQATYIDKIVSDLQEFSRNLMPKIEEVDINTLVKSLLTRMRIPDNITVNVRTGNNLPKTHTDPVCITRIVTNLVTNAIQAMPKGGTLSVTTGNVANRAILTIQDTGEGIPEEIKPKLFQPLITSKSKGQGFGLAVCKRLIDALKGNITFETEKGKGTKFTITLPEKT